MPHIGPYSLHTIETGRFGLDGGAMFGIVPKPLWQKHIAADERNRILLAMRCLLLEGKEHLILIDTGIGTTFDQQFADIYAVDHEHSDLERSLQAAGFSPDDITDVVLTHLHFDHCGGATRYDAQGNLALTFKNARHHVQQEHWQWAHDPPAREAGSFLEENIQPLADSSQLNLLDGEGELFPGVEVGTIFGHTIGQQIVRISDGDETLVYAADLVPTHAHTRPAWTMAYDVHPLQTEQEREQFLSEAAAEGWSLFLEHDPEVVVANIEKTSGSYSTIRHRSLHDL